MCLNLDLSDISLWLHSVMYHWQTYYRSDAVSFSLLPPRWHVSLIPSSTTLQVMFTVITWSRWCLPGFSTIKSLIPLCNLKAFCGGDTETGNIIFLVKCPFFSFIYLYLGELMVPYFIQYVLTHCYHDLSRCSSCPRFGSRALERRLSSCGAWAQWLRGMWDLPGPGLEPVSPALAGDS